ncbi:hypothetical protein QQF64_021746 [Cirrhinus molitorella]|uniref:Uncharacterized protein n=1 Tax=Cirrhinus molitorella TaxID=172907 RepID=A0ABR3L6H0_9TELE
MRGRERGRPPAVLPYALLSVHLTRAGDTSPQPQRERERENTNSFMSFCLVDFFDMESPTKEIEDFENNSLKYLQPDQIEKIWLRLRGLRKYKKTSQR